MMESLLFFCVISAQGVDGHLDTVDDRFGQADQGPDGGDTDAAGADEADFLRPNGIGKSCCRLTISRDKRRCQIGDEDVPGQERTD